MQNISKLFKLLEYFNRHVFTVNWKLLLVAGANTHRMIGGITLALGGGGGLILRLP